MKSKNSPNYPWEVTVLFTDEDKLFLEDLAFIHGGVGLSTLIRILVREKQRSLEDENAGQK